MIKRERSFYDSNKDKRLPKFIHTYQDSLHLYMEISLRIKLSQLLLNDNLLKFNFPNSNMKLYLTSQIISMIDLLHCQKYRDLK